MKRILPVAAALLFVGFAVSQQPTPIQVPPRQVVPKSPTTPTAPATYKLEAVAETKLLMDALAHPNYKGLGKHLRDRPNDNASWTFARGQALLIAETGNLLMLRPPKTQGRELWFERAAELRSKATNLARTIAAKDFDGSRVAYVDLANSCNRCHQSFRIAVEVEPYAKANDE
jgi:hypothetical protein